MDAALFATVGLRMYAAELSLCAPDAATCDYVTYHFALRWLSKSQSTGPKAGLNLIFYILYYGFIFCTLLCLDCWIHYLFYYNGTRKKWKEIAWNRVLLSFVCDTMPVDWFEYWNDMSKRMENLTPVNRTEKEGWLQIAKNAEMPRVTDWHWQWDSMEE